MKLLIVGSRKIEDFELPPYISSEVELIISGGAEGMDAVAERYADSHRISKLILCPDYKRYGRAAPIKRNCRMVDLADAVLAVWDGLSAGTRSTIEYARRKNKPLTVVLWEK